MTKTATRPRTAARRSARRPAPVVQLEGVGYTYGDGTVALEGVDLAVAPGEIVGVTGSTESGKTTLMRLLDGVIEPAAGSLDVGEVGWLVPAIGITAEDAMRLGATWAELSLLSERTPAVLLVDEPADGVTSQAAVDDLHDTLREAADRGAAVVVASHLEDTIAVCDRALRLDRRRPVTRAEAAWGYRRAVGPQERPMSLDELEGEVGEGALVVMDTGHGCYVVLQRLQWQTRQFAPAAHWVVIDSATMRRIWRRKERHDERTMGPRVDRRLRLLEATAGEMAADPDGDERRWRYGGDIAKVGGAHAWWPGRGQLVPWLEPPPDEEAFATYTTYTPPHPLALTAEQCAELIALAGVDLPPSKSGQAHRANETIVDEHLPRALRQHLVLAVQTANAAWWRFDLDDVRGFQLKRYGPGRSHPLHVDLAPTASTRKLVASVQLSGPDDYSGGALVLHTPGLDRQNVVAPRQQGTVIVYPTWTPHVVEPITGGVRWSLVVQCYGPRFR